MSAIQNLVNMAHAKILSMATNALVMLDTLEQIATLVSQSEIVHRTLMNEWIFE